MTDRRIHAVLLDGGEVVRYERAGKWYVEYPPERLIPRRHLTLKMAVSQVTDPEREWVPNVVGGSTFDREIRKRLS